MRRGFIFACTKKSEKEMLDNLIFATNKVYGYKVLAIRKDDFVFLYNIDTDILYGTFISTTDGQYDNSIPLFNGRYPYFVKVQPKTEIKKLNNASIVFRKLKISWRDILSERGVEVLSKILENKNLTLSKNISGLVEKNFRPPIFSTTLWDFPRQSYGDKPKGNNKYPGVTPAFIIYNLIHRYTEPNDLVCDPMAGSGTTIDVCKEERRRVIAFDIVPTRPDIIQADARKLPLKDNSVDMIFIDSPYGDNIKYNEHPLNIGNIPASDEKFYDELEKVMQECYRILKYGKVLAWLIGDQWAKKTFIPVGFKVYERLTKYFQPVDIICVVRRNQSSNTPFWHSKAIQHNFYLRGFKYLIIVKKEHKKQNFGNLKIEWRSYER
ncbi:MAG: DNA methyltransferase [candidate division WOR-3 bacterium]|jgi:DNA modification methylase